MPTRHLLLVSVLLLAAGVPALAQAPAAPGDKEPVLRVEAGGPTSFVTALSFSADGKILYTGGWDKVVRVWSLGNDDRFVPDRIRAYRPPVGPGLEGALNALALSEKGVVRGAHDWLAVSGWGAYRRGPGFRRGGVIGPT